MMIKSNQMKKKFTLIEVIIAISLLVTVIGILFLGTGTVMSSWEQLGRHTKSLEELFLLDRSLDSILTNIIPMTWPNEENNKQESLFTGDSDRVVFSYIHSFNRLEDGAIRTCNMFVEDEALVIYYCERPPFPENLNSEIVKRSILAYDIDSVRFTYVDLDEGNLEFKDTWEDEDYLPLGIRVDVRFMNGTRQSWFRRTAGSSFYERWGKYEQKERT